MDMVGEKASETIGRCGGGDKGGFAEEGEEEMTRPSVQILMAWQAKWAIIFKMKLEEIHRSVTQLTDSRRATLAADLLCTLPGILVDEDEGVSEARRRSRELAADSSAGCTWEEIKRDLGR
jgi:hypothetical protein